MAGKDGDRWEEETRRAREAQKMEEKEAGKRKRELEEAKEEEKKIIFTNCSLSMTQAFDRLGCSFCFALNPSIALTEFPTDKNFPSLSFTTLEGLAPMVRS